MTDKKDDETTELDDELKEIFENPSPENIIPNIKKVETRKLGEIDTSPVIMAEKKEKSENAIIAKQANPVAEVTMDETQERDFNYTRNTLYEVIEIGVESLKQLSVVAEKSQHPRCHEVVATLIKNISESTKELLSLHKTMKDITKEELPNQKNITNNNLILTTEDLLKKIKGIK